MIDPLIIEYKVYKYRRHKREKKRHQMGVVSPLLLIKHYNDLFKFFKKQNYINRQYVKDRIEVPNKLSFELNNDETILFFKHILSLYILTNKQLVIDFGKCNYIDTSVISLLLVCFADFERLRSKYNSTYYHPFANRVVIKPSKYIEVNKRLFSFGIIEEPLKGVSTSDKFHVTGLLYGYTYKKLYKSYRGAYCKKIRNLVNDALQQTGYMLNPSGVTKIDNIFSEIFGNAEDHSLVTTWYLNGAIYMTKDKESSEDIVELDIVIMNLGFSIYEGMVDQQEKNSKMMKKVEGWYLNHTRQDPSLSKECLYTLYSLQEGISRLKFEDESRGNGTMSFIKSFMLLGKFGQSDRYQSKLNIISGNSIIRCTPEYEPYKKANRYFLSLNKESNFDLPPSTKCLFSSKESLPGTIIEVKIYMNKNFFNKTLQSNGNDN